MTESRDRCFLYCKQTLNSENDRNAEFGEGMTGASCLVLQEALKRRISIMMTGWVWAGPSVEVLDPMKANSSSGPAHFTSFLKFPILNFGYNSNLYFF